MNNDPREGLLGWISLTLGPLALLGVVWLFLFMILAAPPPALDALANRNDPNFVDERPLFALHEDPVVRRRAARDAAALVVGIVGVPLLLLALARIVGRVTGEVDARRGEALDAEVAPQATLPKASWVAVRAIPMDGSGRDRVITPDLPDEEEEEELPDGPDALPQDAAAPSLGSDGAANAEEASAAGGDGAGADHPAPAAAAAGTVARSSTSEGAANAEEAPDAAGEGAGDVREAPGGAPLGEVAGEPVADAVRDDPGARANPVPGVAATADPGAASPEVTRGPPRRDADLDELFGS